MLYRELLSHFDSNAKIKFIGGDTEFPSTHTWNTHREATAIDLKISQAHRWPANKNTVNLRMQFSKGGTVQINKYNFRQSTITPLRLTLGVGGKHLPIRLRVFIVVSWVAQTNVIHPHSPRFSSECRKCSLYQHINMECTCGGGEFRPPTLSKHIKNGDKWSAAKDPERLTGGDKLLPMQWWCWRRG